MDLKKNFEVLEMLCKPLALDPFSVFMDWDEIQADPLDMRAYQVKKLIMSKSDAQIRTLKLRASLEGYQGWSLKRCQHWFDYYYHDYFVNRKMRDMRNG